MYIYKITNLKSGKLYIGKTTQSLKPTARWNRHTSDALRGKGSSLHSAIRKYGVENFSYEIIDGANSESELSYLELHYIHKFNTLAPNGYNLKLESKPHAETKLALSQYMKQNVDLDKMKKLTELSKEKSTQKVKALNILTNEITIFRSLKECSNFIGGNYKYLGEILNGKRMYKPYKNHLVEYLNRETLKVTTRTTRKDKGIKRKL